MALTNEIQVARYNAILHKLLAMKEGAPAPILMPEVMSALVLENDRPEWAFLAGEHIAQGFGQRNALAASLSYVGVQNPPNSGIILVVEQAWAESDSTGRTELRLAVNVEEVATPSSFAKVWRDLRGAAVQGSEGLGITGDIRGSATAGGAPAGGNSLLYKSHSAAASLLTYPGGAIILSPNSFLFWAKDTVNVTLIAGFSWRERAFEPSETR